MPNDKLIFDPKYTISLNDLSSIDVKDPKNNKIVKTYKNPKKVYDTTNASVIIYSSGLDKIALKREISNSNIPSEAIIYEKLKKYNCGVIRLRYVQNHYNNFIHYYIMDGFDGDLENLKPGEIDPYVLGKVLKKYLTCLYTKFKPSLWYTDLKLANIFFCKKDKIEGLPGEIYLGDLGSLEVDRDGENVATYPAPEFRHNKGFLKIQNKKEGEKVISWVLGITLLQSVLGSKELRYFFYTYIANKTDKELKNDIENVLRKITDVKLRDILKNLLELDPKNRKTLKEIKF